MAEETYHHTTDAYSAWHRVGSLKRFIPEETARELAMIDVDVPLYVEYRDGSYDPICLIETAVFKGHYTKFAKVTANLARKANIPAYTVLYELDVMDNPAEPKWQDIIRFHVKRLHPRPETNYKILDSDEYIQLLCDIRKVKAPEDVVRRVETAKASKIKLEEITFDPIAPIYFKEGPVHIGKFEWPDLRSSQCEEEVKEDTVVLENIAAAEKEKERRGCGWKLSNVYQS